MKGCAYGLGVSVVKYALSALSFFFFFFFYGNIA